MGISQPIIFDSWYFAFCLIFIYFFNFSIASHSVEFYIHQRCLEIRLIVAQEKWTYKEHTYCLYAEWLIPVPDAVANISPKMWVVWVELSPRVMVPIFEDPLQALWTCPLKRQVFEGFVTFYKCVTILFKIEKWAPY